MLFIAFFFCVLFFFFFFQAEDGIRDIGVTGVQTCALPICSSHRYRPSSIGLRAMTALVVLRDKVIKPLLASCCQRKRGRKPKNVTPLDTHYHRLQAGMRELFDELGIAA